MSKNLNPAKALIFRIVHKANIEPILADGCYSRSEAKQNTNYVEIGNQELISKRTTRRVPCGPGGTLSDYVPFYFTPYTPMLMNIKTGYNGVQERPMSDIAILVSSLHRLARLGIPFVFTDRHAYLKTAQFSDDLGDLNRITWTVLQARDFKKDDVDKFEKYQAEALIFRYIPVDALSGIVCYDEVTRTNIQNKAASCGSDIKIIAKQEWYL